MTRRIALVALLGAALMAPVLASGPTSYGAARRPDLVVSSVTAPTEVRAGATLTVKVTSQNTGRSKAPASRTTVYLSRDTRAGSDLATAAIRVPGLAPRKKHSAGVRIRVPGATAAGTYRVLACADTAKKVRETKEGNNCRVATRAVRVTVQPVPDSDYPRTPNPYTVTPHTDDTRAVTAYAYQHEATTITATGADGTTYTLEMPAGALVAPEQITLTPLSSVGNLPLSGGLAAAVEMKPHGLILLKPATLTIDSPDLGPIAQQTPFYFHGGGEDFHLYPVLPPTPGDGADVVRLPVMHFSTPGIGLGNATDRDAMADYPTSRLPGQISGDIAELLRRERENQLNGAPPDPGVGHKVVALLTEYYFAAVLPKLRAAEANPRDRGAAFAAIDEALGWLRQMQLLGVGDDEDDATQEMQDAMARVLRIMDAVYNDTVKQCFQEHGLEALPVLLRLARTAQVLGIPWGEAAYQKFLDCSRFEVRFDSRITFAGTWPVGGEELWNYPHTGSGSWRAKATSTNELGNSTFVTQVPLPLTEATYHDEYDWPRSDGTRCHGWTDQTGSVPGILSTGVVPAFQANPREVPPGEEGAWQEPVVDLFIAVTASRVQDVLHSVGCAGSDYTDTLTSRWHGQFTDFHNGYASISLTGKKGDRSGDLMYAETWQNSSSKPNHLGSLDWAETTVLEVWHRPRT